MERGDALRLAPGVYCRTGLWFRHAPWDRYLISAVAYALSRQEPAVFVGPTALLLRGLPSADVPAFLQVRARSAGRAGVVSLPKLYRDGAALTQVYLRHLAAEGQEFGGSFPVLPQVRRRWSTRADRRRLTAAWEFADGRAESPGESLSRATIYELGFEVPEPQKDLYDGKGRWIARVDNWWEGITLAGEFDGKSKYSSGFRKPGASWQDVLVREKEREDAIRRTGAAVMRWLWKDVQNQQRFERLLVHHGVPRRAG